MKLDSVPAPRPPHLSLSTVSKRVLVLDDDVNLLSLYALTLARAGYTIDTAADGERGWEALCATAYDLLLTDHNMPRLTGVGLVARLHDAGMTLPVIIASGSIALPEGAGGRLGFATVLHKPFTSDELVAAVQQLVPLERIAPALINPLAGSAADLRSAKQRAPRV